jgi:hypothetical protein
MAFSYISAIYIHRGFHHWCDDRTKLQLSMDALGQNETLDRRWGVGWPQEHQKTTEKTWRRIFDHFPMDFWMFGILFDHDF